MHHSGKQVTVSGRRLCVCVCVCVRAMKAEGVCRVIMGGWLSTRLGWG